MRSFRRCWRGTRCCSNPHRRRRCVESGSSRRCSQLDCPRTSVKCVDPPSRSSLTVYLQVLHLTPDQMDLVSASPEVSFISFTGSVQTGRHVERVAATHSGVGFKSVGLELGGKDAAYVRQDCDVAMAAENTVDGAFFNSGQSCCAIERIYVHEGSYDAFVQEVVKVVKDYVLGDPREQATTLGPVVSLRSAENIRAQVAEAVKAGARSLIPTTFFPAAKEGTTFVAPHVLVDVNHGMQVMMEETFGPVVCIQSVRPIQSTIWKWRLTLQ